MARTRHERQKKQNNNEPPVNKPSCGLQDPTYGGCNCAKYFCFGLYGRMNASQLKQELIHRISRIEDIDFLNAIKTILDFKRENFIELTANQEKELLFASKEGKKGNVISESEMDHKVDKWLSTIES